MPRARVTERDPTLDHQIYLRFNRLDSGMTDVMCNCRVSPLGTIPNKGDPWPIYNDPARHPKEFTPHDQHTKDARIFYVN